MSNFDLKPLTPENIEAMSFNNDTLWLIELEGKEFGPFETESLKHYACENEEIMQEALARRLDQEEYKEFWSYPQFQRRKMQVLNTASGEGQYWIMSEGLKTGPLTSKEIDAKIDTNLLTMTDLISTDKGENWIKIFQITSFDRRSHQANDLPHIPNERDFHTAKLQVIENLENKVTSVSDELVDLAHELGHKAKIIPFRSMESEPETTHKRWMLPAAVAVLGVIFLTGNFFTEVSAPEVADQPTYKTRTPSAMARQDEKPQHRSYSPPPTYERSPASIRPRTPTIEKIENSPRYPTIIETHEEEYGNNLDYPQDKPERPVVEGEAGPREYSLVGNDTYPTQSLDELMNNEPVEPIVEEVSDF